MVSILFDQLSGKREQHLQEYRGYSRLSILLRSHWGANKITQAWASL